MGLGWATTEMCFLKGVPLPAHPALLHIRHLLIAATKRKTDIAAGNQYKNLAKAMPSFFKKLLEI